MGEQFFSQRVTGRSPLADLGFAQLDNPFCTDRYVMAMQELGYECWVIGIRANGVLRDATIAVVQHGRMSAALEITSLPTAAQRTTFWDGVYALSKSLKITDLIAETFASPHFEIPPLRGEISRKNRNEYVLALDNDDFAARLCSNHKRNIKKARAAGVSVRHRSLHSESLVDHVRLIGQSIDRRAARGESVSTRSVDTKAHWAYLKSGAGELYQAAHNGRVVSSVLLLRSPWTAYYQSAGTSPEGMRIGASPFLIHDVCRELFHQGVRTFNLGGAPEGSSLAGFKTGFGTAQVTLCECTCYVGPGWFKKLRSALRLGRTGRAQFGKLLAANLIRRPVNTPLAR